VEEAGHPPTEVHEGGADAALHVLHPAHEDVALAGGIGPGLDVDLLEAPVLEKDDADLFGVVGVDEEGFFHGAPGR
jgi:hypothetical protein